MSYDGLNRRVQTDDIQGLAELSLRNSTPVDSLKLRREEDSGKDETLVRSAVRAKFLKLLAVPERGAQVIRAVEHSPEQKWFSDFKTRFDDLQQIRPNIKFSDVEKSLLADTEAMRKLMVLDDSGHKMNVFAEENGRFIFVSSWNNVNNLSLYHRNIAYNSTWQRAAVLNKCPKNGNAVDIAKSIGVDIADQKFHAQLMKVTQIIGNAWLKTEQVSKVALVGEDRCVRPYYPDVLNNSGSFRAQLELKKAV